MKHLSRSLVFLSALLLSALAAYGQDLDRIRGDLASGNVELERNALFQIRLIGSAEASRLALPLLNDPNELVRATAPSAVIYLPKSEAASVLIPLLSDKAEFVRQETAYALGKVGDASAVPPLIKAIHKDSDPVRNAATVALGEIGDAFALETLSELLKKKPTEDNEFLRRAAAHSIGEIAGLQKTPVTAQFRNAGVVLVKVLQSNKEAEDTRREAARALGAIGDPQAVGILKANVNSSDTYLAEICRNALRKLGSPE